MLFNSYNFFIFFIIIVAIYWSLNNNKKRIFFLVIASFVFYGFSYPPNLLILLYSILVNYYCAIRINNAVSKTSKKLFLMLSILGNLSILLFFKYINFLMGLFFYLLPFLKSHSVPRILEISLPLGISFFTFQGMAYTIDVYRGKVKAEKIFINFAFFKSFFSQLIAGPILRAADFLPQLIQEKIFNKKNIEMGFYLILWGLVKKVVIADNIAPIANEYFSNPTDNFFSAWVAIYAFAFQIYCDFSGYCDIAIGCAKILDYKIPLNFTQPYLSKDITSFWHNWHITLSSWFRDYLFIPLGGSRVKTVRYYFNLVITMLAAGLWHGANYTFLVWGLYHGIILVLHKVYVKLVRVRIPKIIGILATFHLVCIGWIFFKAQNIHLAWYILCSALKVHNIGIVDLRTTMNLVFFTLPLLILQILERRFSIKQNFATFPYILRFGFVIIAILSIVSFGTMGNEFIYFEF